MADNKRWYSPLSEAFRFSVLVAAHTLSMVVIILGLTLVQHVLSVFGEPKLFDMLPLSYIFDALDIVVLLGFAVLLVTDIADELRRRSHE